MGTPVRTLNEKGIQIFREYLAELRIGLMRRAPVELLEDPGYTAKMKGGLEVEKLTFHSKLDMVKYLFEKFQNLPSSQIDQNIGLWSWLSLYYFDQVCPANTAGKRDPGQDCRHILDLDFRRYYRHLLNGPYNIFRFHGERAPLLLSGPLNKPSKFYEELSSRQGFVTNKGVIEAANFLYYDPHRKGPKSGAGGITRKSGTLLRFIDVVQQLDLNYDLYSMTGAEVLALLPSEFDEWIPKERLKATFWRLFAKGKGKSENE
jgi:hypothetical protein